MPDNPFATVSRLFPRNPTYEVPNLSPTISATAAACETAAQAISTAATASNQANSDARTAKGKLEIAIAAGCTRLSGLRTELDQILYDEDPLWYAFGFERPSDPATPEVPENLVVTIGAAGSGMVFADWDDARRADKYRATLLTSATPPVQLASKLVTESEATFTGVPEGAFKVIVTATNAAGESQPSAPTNGTLV